MRSSTLQGRTSERSTLPFVRAGWAAACLPLLLLMGCGGMTAEGPVASKTIRLSGTIVSEDGSPVSGVEIDLGTGGHGTKSDSHGRFALDDLPAGKLDVTVGSNSSSGFTLDALQARRHNSMVVTLSSDDQVKSARVSRVADDDDEEQAIHRLVRPDGSPDYDARGKIEIQQNSSDDEEFDIEVKRLNPGNYELWIGDPTNLGVLTHVVDQDFTVGSHGEYEIEFETRHGGDLPFAQDDLDPFFGLPVEIRGAGGTYLVSTVPFLPVADLKRRAESNLHRAAGIFDGEGEINIKSKRRVQDERFKVEVEHLRANTIYDLCVNCSAIPKPGAALPDGTGAGKGSPRTAMPLARATFSLTNESGTPGSTVHFPVTLTTTDLVALPQFTVEYKGSHLTFVKAVTNATGFASPPVVNTALPFPTRNPAVLDRHVLVQLPVTGATITGSVVIVTLEFTVGSPAGATSNVEIDLTSTDGRAHTFLGLDDGVTTLTDPDITATAGSITITSPPPGSFVCIGSFTTDDEGEGEIKIKNTNGQQLPCGKQNVCELAHLPVEIQEHSTGQVILEGSVPPLAGPCP